MKLSYYNFYLPKELIAEKPAKQRDEARMMVLHRDTKTIEHRIFKDLIEYVTPGDAVVANNTKVFPALLYGEKEKTGASITVFLQRELNRDMRLWDVIVDPARKIRIGNKLYFGPNESLVAEVIDNTTSRGRTVRFLFDGTHEEFIKHIRSLGHTPLPDELRAIRNIENYDADRYQKQAETKALSFLHWDEDPPGSSILAKKILAYFTKCARVCKCFSPKFSRFSSNPSRERARRAAMRANSFSRGGRGAMLSAGLRQIVIIFIGIAAGGVLTSLRFSALTIPPGHVSVK